MLNSVTQTAESAESKELAVSAPIQYTNYWTTEYDRDDYCALATIVTFPLI